MTIAAGTIIKDEAENGETDHGYGGAQSRKEPAQRDTQGLAHIGRPAAHVVDHDINHRGAGENVKHNVQGLRDAHGQWRRLQRANRRS